jgi:hypothetical protein
MELVLLAIAAAAIYVFAQERRKRQVARDHADDEFRAVRRVADEDVTRFGEELQELHIETLTTELDAPMRQDYQRALDSYENAKQLLNESSTPADISQVTKALEDGRYAQACVLARRDGAPLPQRRPPCFFNPAHGPAQTDVEWAPPGGVRREIPVCLADADRLAQGAEPDVRTVRVGNRMVPWYQGGPRYAPYADGYYGGFALQGLFPGFVIGSMMSGMWGPAMVAPAEGDTSGEGSTDGDWSGDGSGGGGDGGGWDYGDGGGGFGGGDGGGGSGGGWGGDSGGWGGDFGGGGDGGGGF